jgi:hypothetical protein
MACRRKRNILHQDPETSGLLSEESIYQTDQSGGQTKQQYTTSHSKQINHFLSVKNKYLFSVSVELLVDTIKRKHILYPRISFVIK